MKYLLLFALLLHSFLPTQSIAQTALGQPTLDEQKVQIWCAAVRFVYDDTGRPNLKSKLNCGGSLKQFENSIKADSQKVYSLLYQPLEGRGAMYKGLGSDKSRLQKLKDEIINKLKASPSRKASPTRMQAVDRLATSLTNYVESGTPPSDVSSRLNEEASSDTSTDEATAAAPADAGPEDNPNYNPPTPTGNKEGVMSSLFAPIAFILSLLSLVLFWLLRRSLKELDARTSRYRKELEDVKANSVSAPLPGGTFSSKRLTPEMHAEIEHLVQQRVAEELALQQNTHNVTNKETLDYGLATEKKTSAEWQHTENRPTIPGSTSAPAVSVASDLSAPSAYLPLATPQPETPLPAGPPSASPRDEFDSLVPPVQLPAPESYAAVAAAPASVRYVYVKAPVSSMFNEDDFQQEPQPDSIYELMLDANKPDTATFQVNPDPSVHTYAIQNAQYSLYDACQYPQPDDSASYIINDEPGKLRRIGPAWQIEQKAIIHFE